MMTHSFIQSYNEYSEMEFVKADCNFLVYSQYNIGVSQTLYLRHQGTGNWSHFETLRQVLSERPYFFLSIRHDFDLKPF